MKQIDELVDIGADTPIWQRYKLKIMSLSQQVRLKTSAFPALFPAPGPLLLLLKASPERLRL